MEESMFFWELFVLRLTVFDAVVSFIESPGMKVTFNG
jgi:hypothetical protein